MLYLIIVVIICCFVKSISDNSSKRVSIEDKRLKEEQREKNKNEEKEKMLKDIEQTLNNFFELKELRDSQILSDNEVDYKKQETLYRIIYLVKEKKIIEMSTVLIRLKPLIEDGFLSEEEVKKLKEFY